MSLKPGIRVDTSRFDREMARLRNMARPMRAAGVRLGIVGERETKRRSPVKTGFHRASIGYRVEVDANGGVTVIVTHSSEYGAYLEWGTGRRTEHPAGPRSNRLGMRARPHFRPGLQRMVAESRGILTDELNRHIRGA
jgi:HK97 gp10 family phage protein